MYAGKVPRTQGDLKEEARRRGVRRGWLTGPEVKLDPHTGQPGSQGKGLEAFGSRKALFPEERPAGLRGRCHARGNG